MKNKRIIFLLQTLLGMALLALGTFVFTSDNVKMFDGLCIGAGAAMTVLGAGQFLQSLIIPAVKVEEIKKWKEIEVNDERNIRIKEKTGYMVMRIMNYVLSANILILGFMGVDTTIILLAVSLLVIEFALVIYFSNHYAHVE